MVNESDKDEVKGRVKEAAGALTGDEQLKRDGERDRAKATVKDVIEDVKNVATDVVDLAGDAIGKVLPGRRR